MGIGVASPNVMTVSGLRWSICKRSSTVDPCCMCIVFVSFDRTSSTVTFNGIDRDIKKPLINLLTDLL